MIGLYEYYTVPDHMEFENVTVTDFYCVTENSGGRQGMVLFDKQSGENYIIPERYFDFFGQQKGEQLTDNTPSLYLTVYRGTAVEIETDDWWLDDIYAGVWCSYGYGIAFRSYCDSLFAGIDGMNWGLVFGMILPAWFIGSALVHGIDRKAAIKKAFRETSRYTPKRSSALIEY
ncbi:MAG: hypothetical protein K2N72_09730 [Oscillospiraceae bacterium]|nr:hypothetical protein [Oscillospiraceae bacterium]